MPVADRLGEENGGWQVAMGTLGHERVGTAGLSVSMGIELDALIATARAHNPAALEDPVTRDRIARLWTQLELTRLLNARALSKILKGQPNWPEVPLAKLQWSYLSQTIAELGVDVLGPLGRAGQGRPRCGRQGALGPQLRVAALHVDRRGHHRGAEEHHRRPGHQDASPLRRRPRFDGANASAISIAPSTAASTAVAPDGADGRRSTRGQGEDARRHEHEPGHGQRHPQRTAPEDLCEEGEPEDDAGEQGGDVARRHGRGEHPDLEPALLVDEAGDADHGEGVELPGAELAGEAPADVGQGLDQPRLQPERGPGRRAQQRRRRARAGPAGAETSSTAHRTTKPISVRAQAIPATWFVPPVGLPPTRNRTRPTTVVVAPRTWRRPTCWSVSHTPNGRAMTKLDTTMAWTTRSDPTARAYDLGDEPPDLQRATDDPHRVPEQLQEEPGVLARGRRAQRAALLHGIAQREGDDAATNASSTAIVGAGAPSPGCRARA